MAITIDLTGGSLELLVILKRLYPILEMFMMCNMAKYGYIGNVPTQASGSNESGIFDVTDATQTGTKLKNTGIDEMRLWIIQVELQLL